MKNMDKGLTVPKMINEKHGQGTDSTKMGADKLAKKYPKCHPSFSNQFVCPSPKVWDFRKKSLSGCLPQIPRLP